MAWVKYINSRKKTGYICLNPLMRSRRRIDASTGEVIYYDPEEYPEDRYDRWNASDFIDVHETSVIYVCTDFSSYGSNSAWYDENYNYIRSAGLALKTNVPSNAYYLKTSGQAPKDGQYVGTTNFYLIMEVYDG